MTTWIAAPAATLTVIGMLLGTNAASAADRFAVISIANETNANVRVTYRWGNDAKKSYTFAPGNRHWFSYQYPKQSQPSSPDFFISYDADSQTGGKYIEDKRLHGFRAPDQSYDLGNKYVFKYDGPSKRFIELYDRR